MAQLQYIGARYVPKYYENSVDRYLRKYQACSNASVNQVMFAFEDQKLEDEMIDEDGNKNRRHLLSILIRGIYVS